MSAVSTGPWTIARVRRRPVRASARGCGRHRRRRGAPTPTQRLSVRDREFTVTFADDRSLTATFVQLCDSPLAPAEYRHWSRIYPHWTITDVPPLDEVGPSAQQRFVSLIDVLVDADISLDVHSSVDLDVFLSRTAGRPDAFRMASRLRLLQRD